MCPEFALSVIIHLFFKSLTAAKFLDKKDLTNAHLKLS